jgi:hypothetical protein
MKFIFYFAAANLERSDNSCSEQYLQKALFDLSIEAVF